MFVMKKKCDQQMRMKRVSFKRNCQVLRLLGSETREYGLSTELTTVKRFKKLTFLVFALPQIASRNCGLCMVCAQNLELREKRK